MSGIEFFVRGIPQSQGSTKAFVRNGKPIITSTNKSLKTWRTLVALEAQNHAPEFLFMNAVAMDLTFFLPRPKNLPKKQWRHAKRPDLDKLIRAICDSLSGIVYRDDSQVFNITAAKFYETLSRGPAAYPVGVKIEVRDVGVD